MSLKGASYAVMAALCFGIMPILTKQLYGETRVDPFFFLMVRYSLAAILMWVYLLASRNRTLKKINRGDLSLIAITSCCYILVTSTYFIALQFIDASLNSLLVFTFPVFTPFLGFLFFKEKLHWVPVVAATIGFFGCLMVIGGYHLQGTTGETFGIGLGLFSGVVYAMYTLFGQKITVRFDPLTVTALNLSIVALFFLFCRINWLWRTPQPTKVYLVAGIIAVISTILANVFYFEAIRAVGAVKAGIFSSLEPLFTAVLAITFLNERVAAFQWIGATLILAGMVIVQRPWELKRH